MFTLSLVTPEKKLVTDAEVDEVIVPAFKGELDILPGHAPLMTTLSTGVLRYRLKGSATLVPVVVSWGYCEVHGDGVVILAETAESLQEIDRERAERAMREAEKRLMDPMLEPDQITQFQRKLSRAQVRLAAARNETSH